jgi:hypothetical protein
VDRELAARDPLKVDVVFLQRSKKKTTQVLTPLRRIPRKIGKG